MTCYKFLFLVLALLTLGHSAAAQSPLTMFGNVTPQNPVIADSAVTLGVKFYSTQAGTIAGIRFYRGHSNSNGYTVKLFSASGSLLASAATSKDTCAVPCWEQVNFASPISIAANTTYVAAYYTSNGDYADDEYTNGGLTNGASNGPLIAPASSQVGGNGVYTYSTGLPNQTWHDSNYYVERLIHADRADADDELQPGEPVDPEHIAGRHCGGDRQCDLEQRQPVHREAQPRFQ